MVLKVEFVTLGGASEWLDVPAPTLRNWTDQLEELGVHHTKRNHRNERIYFEDDLRIFEYVRDMRREYGRKTTTKDLARILMEDDRFKLRETQENPQMDIDDEPVDLLSQEDIKNLMSSERVKQFMRIVVDQTTKNLKEELEGDLVEALTKNLKEELQSKLKEQEEMHNRVVEVIKKSNNEVLSRIETYGRREDRGFWGRLFGK